MPAALYGNRDGLGGLAAAFGGPVIGPLPLPLPKNRVPPERPGRRGPGDEGPPPRGRGPGSTRRGGVITARDRTAGGQDPTGTPPINHIPPVREGGIRSDIGADIAIALGPTAVIRDIVGRAVIDAIRRRVRRDDPPPPVPPSGGSGGPTVPQAPPHHPYPPEGMPPGSVGLPPPGPGPSIGHGPIPVFTPRIGGRGNRPDRRRGEEDSAPPLRPVDREGNPVYPSLPPQSKVPTGKDSIKIIRPSGASPPLPPQGPPPPPRPLADRRPGRSDDPIRRIRRFGQVAAGGGTDGDGDGDGGGSSVPTTTPGGG